MSGKWSEPGVPHKGWICTGVTDMEEPIEVCGMCEARMIRYVHHMEHESYDGGLGVGCVCASNMEEDYEAAEKRERPLRAAASRREREMEKLKLSALLTTKPRPVVMSALAPVRKEPPMSPFADCQFCGSRGALRLPDGRVYCADCWRSGPEYQAYLARLKGAEVDD